uniref:S1 motif domain-containing protein n=1 Tax=Timspurckia oligopyrenoides TaxID=708627 RepID=A0A7S1EQJ4_9RHOD|mmetsp:Transcript_12052/g.21808  ORF Transcript_12052/g.21808 Transcript_12052/m.21808 type:complete len:252 (+) Transcript_12052:21-776(+)
MVQSNCFIIGLNIIDYICYPNPLNSRYLSINSSKNPIAFRFFDSTRIHSRPHSRHTSNLKFNTSPLNTLALSSNDQSNFDSSYTTQNSTEYLFFDHETESRDAELDSLKQESDDEGSESESEDDQSSGVSLSTLKVGDIHVGVVKMILSYGCFVDIGFERPGLVHRSEISFKYVKDVSNFVYLGQKVRVLVTQIDLENNTWGCSIKQVIDTSLYNTTVWLATDWGHSYKDSNGNPISRTRREIWIPPRPQN